LAITKIIIINIIELLLITISKFYYFSVLKKIIKMKKHILFIFALSLFCSTLSAQSYSGNNIGNKISNRVILTHPTVYNIQIIENLIQKNIIKISNLEIVGVYHKDEQYDYSKSIKYLKNKQYSNYSLQKISDTLFPAILYTENDCSDDFKRLFENSEAIIFFGGPDIPPITYNKKLHLLTNVTDPYRHYFELSFIYHLLGNYANTNYTPLLETNLNYGIYGFCLGMQSMNIGTGGIMYQDIPSEIYNTIYAQDIVKLEINQQHRNYYKSILQDPNYFSGNFHKIKIIENKFTNNSLDKNFTPTVYSNHHQAVSKTGKGLYVIASSLDEKIIEAVAHKKYPNVLGVQFHPEASFLYNNKKYKQSPNTARISGKEILENNKSFQFHIDYWNKFNKIFNN